MKNLPWPYLNEKGETITPATGIPGFRLKVRMAHIAQGIRRSSYNCMEAIAVREQLGCSSTNVTREHLIFNLNGIRYNFLRPAKAVINLDTWDDEEEAYRAAKHAGKDFVSKIKPYSIMFRGTSATCSPVLKRGPFKTPRTKHPTRGKKLRKAARRGVRRYHGLREIVKP